MDIMLRDDKGLKNQERKLQEQRSLPNINRLAHQRESIWQQKANNEPDDEGKVGNFTTPEYKLKSMIKQSNMERYNRNNLN